MAGCGLRFGRVDRQKQVVDALAHGTSELQLSVAVRRSEAMYALRRTDFVPPDTATRARAVLTLALSFADARFVDNPTGTSNIKYRPRQLTCTDGFTHTRRHV